jgi:2,4-dienoyl-CoA reductase (NADPH2)
MINTGIGWHEARIPTIATRCRGGVRVGHGQAEGQSRRAAGRTTNRINDPAVAEALLRRGLGGHGVDGAAAARRSRTSWRRRRAGRADEINTCIACNQACLDHVFERKLASCLVNPAGLRARPNSLYAPAASKRRIAVVGAGPAGLACA